ncbi:4-hydroxythreonine-4-phosphate dehydrogenase [Marinomonas sp. MED121]|uniref:4-hydroxythreonine-4-phosphate dehydrogenase PdxA n=1 Tax=Marinomonas sp. MED121 TaxID=314277 RepID=UPI0000690341|nr:4-hydroxythreonine-4-phosphate dehydrogenase PdxA [Marinomonas sp. MED121]EAQ66511.1 4-hydroxythreonine-4-phosphate dehydrogenase [Marinomonas sp. MED121]
MSSNLPTICITGGEPTGIAPDIILKALQQNFNAHIVVLSSKKVLEERAKALNIKTNIIQHSAEDARSPHKAGEIHLLALEHEHAVIPGKLDKQHSPYVLKTLELAAEGCLTGQFDAIVTPPVHKGVLCETGIHFSGHTEFFQQKCNSEQVVMMLATEGLKVALATTHLPLKDVSSAITKESLTQVIEALNKDLKTRFGHQRPRILVCGLNPHAGEDGHLGMEEIETIIPVLDTLKKQGMDLVGPLPADTLFSPKNLENCDCVLAMYHDQGLPVLKYKGFGNAVNITLGLPIIRTSVDHGTALELAGTGDANEGSLIIAINHAIEMANNAKKFPK